MFVSNGLDTLLNPKPKVDVATPLLEKAGDALPIDDPPPPSTLVQVDAAVKVVAGSLLAAGYVPRLASAALAASLVPTTIAGHAFWEEEDDEQRTAHQLHFSKNLAMLGGLMLAAADTHGKPSLGWWARRGLRHAGRATQHAAGSVAGTTQYAASTVAGAAHDVADRAVDVADRVSDVTEGMTKRVRSAVR